MTGKKMMTIALGGLMMFNVAGITVPAMTTTAEAAIHHDRDHNREKHHNDEYNRALRAEHERHEQKMREIRHKYHSRRHKMQQEMQKERDRHERIMREINQRYRDHHHDTHRHDNHRHDPHHRDHH